MSDVEYWKQRAKLAEDELERFQEPAIDPLERKRPSIMGCVSQSELDEQWTAEDQARVDGLTAEAIEAVRLLMISRLNADETASDVARRLLGYMEDRTAALTAIKRAGYPDGEWFEVIFSVKPAVERLLADLSSGRQTIDFLSRPPKLPVEALPVGAVFTTRDGRLLEVKRERLPDESLVATYQWDRNLEPRTIDRREMVQPIGRVVFNSERKCVVLGLLELSQHAIDQMVSNAPASKQLGG